MKIEQTPEFQPITITLETAKDVEAFWSLVRVGGTTTSGKRAKELSTEISDWFSNHAQLGGK